MDAFGRYGGDDPQRQLDQAERWLAAHPNDPALLRTLGRLAQRARQWAKAQAYFDSSLLLAPSAEGHLELAQLLEEIGQRDAAGAQYRAGLRLAATRPGSPADLPVQTATALTVSAPAVDDRSTPLSHEA